MEPTTLQAEWNRVNEKTKSYAHRELGMVPPAAIHPLNRALRSAFFTGAFSALVVISKSGLDPSLAMAKLLVEILEGQNAPSATLEDAQKQVDDILSKLKSS